MAAEQIRLRGRVQGVGMRPTLLRLARRHGLQGAIRNDGDGVELTVTAGSAALDAFVGDLPAALPPLARIDEVLRRPLETPPPAGLTILPSARAGAGAVVLPDAATCADCLAEVLDPAARRYGYAFTNCTHCGPRLSIQQAIPWDRERTTMAGFALCPDCAVQYADVEDRRYHAQPIACPACGPRCVLTDTDALPLDGDPIAGAARRLRAGQILAIKGLGGYHLACAADDVSAVRRLRAGKRRPVKPLALMVRDCAAAASIVHLEAADSAMLADPAAPILLLSRRQDCGLPEELAPGQDRLGLMLPATPLHHLLMRAVDGPLVMTSGNIAGAPPLIDDDQARRCLAPVADAWLSHDRPIANRVDDSVMQRVAGQMRVLRLGRGLAPAQAAHGLGHPPAVLALGGHLKATIALLRDADWVVSQHIGDLDQPDNRDDYDAAIVRYLRLFDFTPELIAVDAHPDYASTRAGEALAAARGLPVVRVQHHHAHAAACLAEHGRDPQAGPRLAVCFDGLGYGQGGELWGGELLAVDGADFRRLGRWRPAALPGGEQAMREPWRNLAAVLAQLGDQSECARAWPELAGGWRWPQAITAVLESGRHAPPCSSVGRAFDAAACLLNLAPAALSHEAEAAMALEAAARGASPLALPELAWDEDGELPELDWRPLWRGMLDAAEAGAGSATLAAGFHQAIARATAAACRRLVDGQGLPDEVVLSGGVFQNALLTQACVKALGALGLRALLPRRLPCNDGGLSLGQAWVAAAHAAAGR